MTQILNLNPSEVLNFLWIEILNFVSFLGLEIKKTWCCFPRVFCSFLSQISLPVPFTMDNLQNFSSIILYLSTLIYFYTGPHTEFVDLDADAKKIIHSIQGEILLNCSGFVQYTMHCGTRDNAGFICLQMEDECQEGMSQVRPWDIVFIFF